MGIDFAWRISEEIEIEICSAKILKDIFLEEVFF